MAFGAVIVLVYLCVGVEATVATRSASVPSSKLGQQLEAVAGAAAGAEAGAAAGHTAPVRNADEPSLCRQQQWQWTCQHWRWSSSTRSWLGSCCSSSTPGHICGRSTALCLVQGRPEAVTCLCTCLGALAIGQGLTLGALLLIGVWSSA